MTVHLQLQELADKLRAHEFYSMAEEIDHIMLEGDMESVFTLVALLEQFTKQKPGPLVKKAHYRAKPLS